MIWQVLSPLALLRFKLMNWIKLQKQIIQQFNLFLIALTFFTRIPIGWKIDFSQQKLNQASRYFSLVGWLIGFGCASVFWLSTQFFSVSIAVLISMLFGILLTGSFHEDGLADTCDGFGGGWEKEQKLAIMKDSRLGTYGAVALWFVLTLKYTSLMQVESVVIALLVAHPLSRTISAVMIFLLPYVMDDEISKIKPLAEKQSRSDLLFTLAIGALALLLVLDFVVIISVGLLLLVLFLKALFKKQIGGFTGDTLGATQQLAEIIIYLAIAMGSTS